MSRIFCSLFQKNIWKPVIRQVQETFAPEWIATSSTAAFLKSIGCTVKSLEDIGIKANYLGGKVKSLHPVLYAGVMCDPHNEKEILELQTENIPLIDSVFIDIYRLKVGPEFENAQIDIGGPSILRAASKNYENCLPICHPDIIQGLLKDYPPQKDQDFEEWKKILPMGAKRQCALDVFLMMTDVNEVISHQLMRDEEPPLLTYGDNPGESAHIISRPLWENQERCQPISLGSPEIKRHPEDMKFSWNNVMDIHQAVSLFQWLDAPFKVAIMKHHHTCGVGYSKSSIEAAFEKAHQCDPLSAFGGVVILSHSPQTSFLETLKGKFIDLLVLPLESESLFNELKLKRPKQRVMALPLNSIHDMLFTQQHHRTVFGDVKLNKWQSLSKGLDEKNWEILNMKTPLSDEIRTAVKNAYAVSSHLHSNAIVIADEHGTLGMGVGFVNRVDAIKHAIKQAKRQKPEGIFVLASDGFMPFADNIDAIKDLPLDVIIQPGGSKKDDDVKEACTKKNLGLILTGHRVFFHGI
jgi:phosphoribosylaminoimidazolecarboxamide formyltransferase / IMP cyclohydrolase